MAKFVDQLNIHAKAGDGGDGVVRWLRTKYNPKGGPAGGNGGRGGDVYMRAVRDRNQLAKYTGKKEFIAESGQPGAGNSLYGKHGEDLYIDVPVGSVVTDKAHDRTFELFTEGETVKVLIGGAGGLGNEYFKSSTNQAPQQATDGKPGEAADFTVAVTLIVDVGLIGLPNAGKSTLLNTLTNAQSQVGAYPFTTLEPHLGDLYGYLLADIPGLIEGAAVGKGLGHTFLRHVTRTKMLLHLVSLEHENPLEVYETVRNELSAYDKTLAEKEEWIILSKKDLYSKPDTREVKKMFDNYNKRVFVISENDSKSIKTLSNALVKHVTAS
ncbi:GTPase ObgE [bacterium]|nr:GTPase ObgE [bacterium]|tara:strand:- start:349 stop:1323 length:975 start_codon:yes stop_codon:yes gene_type:complete